ncbi:hypothetical protein PHYSODRAFT_284980, partial [Phytophthora sojae]
MFVAFAAGIDQDSVSRSQGRPKRQSHAGRVYQHVRKGARVTELKERKTTSLCSSVNLSSEKIFYYCDWCAASEAAQ